MSETPIAPEQEEAMPNTEATTHTPEGYTTPTEPQPTAEAENSVEREAGTEQPPVTQEDEKKKKSDSVFWNIFLSMLTLIVAGGAWLVYEQYSKLPDPIKDLKNELNANHKIILEKQAALKVVLKKPQPKQRLLDLLDIQKKTAKEIEATKKEIANEILRRDGIRSEIKAYDRRYRQAAHDNAKGRTFQLLKTVQSGKTFLNVKIIKVEKDGIRILHEQGTTTIDASDLSEDLREQLAFGDPLNIAAMDEADAALKSPVITTDKPKQQPAPAPKPEPKKTVVIEDPEPPSAAPKIDTPTKKNNQSAQESEDVWTPPAHSPLPPL